MRGIAPAGRFMAVIILVRVLVCGGEGSEQAAKSNSASDVANILIQLVEPLDDPGHYCIDVVGFGSGVLLQEPLQAHTCKSTDNRDEQFTHRLATGQLYMEEYRLCVQPNALTSGTPLYLRECSDSRLQDFDFSGDGFIRLGEIGPDHLCVAVTAGDGEVINPIHMRRDLSLEACDATEADLMRWSFSEAVPAQGS